jgi:hypothetical protein
MLADYITPREIDADWADVILVASSENSPAETEQYLKALKAGAAYSKLVHVIDDAADRLASARAQGKKAVEATRERKVLSE